MEGEGCGTPNGIKFLAGGLNGVGIGLISIVERACPAGFHLDVDVSLVLGLDLVMSPLS